MAEPTPELLSHFAIVTFTDDYWRLPAAERTRIRSGWLARCRAASDSMHLYQLAGLESHSDLLVWSSVSSGAPEATAKFFAGWAAALGDARAYVKLRDVLWGYTRPSQYTKTRSNQEVDPFVGARQPFLMVYPFVKTTEWYQFDREKRGAIMGAHIKVGKQYEDITQLLLYSFGLQDQEFVVVYETADPRRFSALVNDMRMVEARIYTLRDSPLHTGLYQANEDALAQWL
jgi:chlorite dismutase